MLLLCLGGALARLMKTENDATINFRDGIAAQSMAEAGLRRAIVVLYNCGDPNGLAETVTRDHFAGSYRITTNMEKNSLRVHSAGQVGSARRSASVLVAVELDPDPANPLTELTILSWGN
jgi:hypothetical protein